MNLLGHLGEGISAYLDGELDSVERRLVEAHLPGCEICRQELDDMMMIRARLRSLPMLDLPTDLTRSTLNAQTRAPYRRPKFLLGAAAAAVVAALVAFATITAPNNTVFALSADEFAQTFQARASLDPTSSVRVIPPAALAIDDQGGGG